MNILTKGTLGLLSLGLLATGVSYASAATDTAASATAPTKIERGFGCNRGGFNNEERVAEHAAQQEKMAKFLGVSVSDLENARAQKTSLEDLALSKGKTKEQLQAFFAEQQAAHKEAMKVKLDADVASGKITTEQRDAMIAWMESPKRERGMHQGMFQRK